MKKDLTLSQHRDFELVPDSLWKALAQWYGGPQPLPRQVFINCLFVYVKNNFRINVFVIILGYTTSKIWCRTRIVSEKSEAHETYDNTSTSRYSFFFCIIEYINIFSLSTNINYFSSTKYFFVVWYGWWIWSSRFIHRWCCFLSTISSDCASSPPSIHCRFLKTCFRKAGKQ